MRMRRLLLASAVLCGIATGYIASPFVSAWNLREAIKRGDTVAIDTRVAWPTVRESLKVLLAKEARLLPMANEAGAAVRPSLWQRLKGAFGATMLDRFIETYVTPEGLPKLFDYRKTWRETVSSTATAAEIEPESKIERFKQFWGRIKRAEFQSLTKVEIEIVDRTSDRRYVSVMELDGLGWKLTSLSVVSGNAPADTASRLADLERAGTVSR